MTDLIFEAPSAAATGPNAISPVRAWLDRLRDHPGEWAKYPERVAPTTSANIKTGKYVGVKRGEFEAVVRNGSGDPARFDLFARYVGGES